MIIKSLRIGVYEKRKLRKYQVSPLPKFETLLNEGQRVTDFSRPNPGRPLASVA
jgi:hypothetical protein